MASRSIVEFIANIGKYKVSLTPIMSEGMHGQQPCLQIGIHLGWASRHHELGPPKTGGPGVEAKLWLASIQPQ